LDDEFKDKRHIYPESIYNLDVKVSFGMGTPTHVPWISFLGPGLSTNNGYYPVYLYYKKVNTLILAYGISETTPFEDPWSDEIINQNMKILEYLSEPFRYNDSYIFEVYIPEIGESKIHN